MRKITVTTDRTVVNTTLSDYAFDEMQKLSELSTISVLNRRGNKHGDIVYIEVDNETYELTTHLHKIIHMPHGTTCVALAKALGSPNHLTVENLAEAIAANLYNYCVSIETMQPHHYFEIVGVCEIVTTREIRMIKESLPTVNFPLMEDAYRDLVAKVVARCIYWKTLELMENKRITI